MRSNRPVLPVDPEGKILMRTEILPMLKSSAASSYYRQPVISDTAADCGNDGRAIRSDGACSERPLQAGNTAPGKIVDAV